MVPGDPRVRAVVPLQGTGACLSREHRNVGCLRRHIRIQDAQLEVHFPPAEPGSGRPGGGACALPCVLHDGHCGGQSGPSPGVSLPAVRRCLLPTTGPGSGWPETLMRHTGLLRSIRGLTLSASTRSDPRASLPWSERTRPPSTQQRRDERYRGGQLRAWSVRPSLGPRSARASDRVGDSARVGTVSFRTPSTAAPRRTCADDHDPERPQAPPGSPQRHGTGPYRRWANAPHRPPLAPHLRGVGVTLPGSGWLRSIWQDRASLLQWTCW